MILILNPSGHDICGHICMQGPYVAHKQCDKYFTYIIIINYHIKASLLLVE